MIRSAVGARSALSSVRINVETKLGRDNNLLADWLQSLTYKFLVCEWPISFRCIEESNAPIVGSAKELDHLSLIRWRPIGRGHAHAPEANG